MRKTACRALLSGVAGAVAVLSLVGCSGTGYPPSVLKGSEVTVAWNGPLASLNVSSTSAVTDGDREVERLTRSQFARERIDRIEFNQEFGRVAIEEQSEKSFTLSYDLEQPQWSDGIALDAADLLLAWAAGSNFFAADGEDASAEDAQRFDSVRSGLTLSDRIPTYDEFERRIEVHFERPFLGWETALDVAVPAHLIGRYALGIDDPMAAKAAIIKAITEADDTAITKIAALWNDGFTLAQKKIPQAELTLSSGPYRVEKVEGDPEDAAQRVTLVANGAYVSGAAARYERIVLQRDESENLEQQVGTTYDVVRVAPRADNFESVRQLERDDYGVSDIDHGVGWVALANTTASGPLRDGKTRNVLMRSFDRGDMVEQGAGRWEGIYPTASSVLFTPGTAGYEVSVQDSGFRTKFHDGGRPDELREKAGLPAGIRICVLYDRTSPMATGMFNSFKQQVAEGGWIATDCGSDMPEQVVTNHRDWDLYLAQVQLPQTPEELHAQWGSGGELNYTGAVSAQRDELIDQLTRETDRYRARDLRVAIEKTIVEQMVAAPLTVDKMIIISSRDLEGVEPRPGRVGALLDRAVMWRPADDTPTTPPADQSDEGDSDLL